MQASRAKKKENIENILEASSKERSDTKSENVENAKAQMEELVEIVRIDKDKCEFTTPVMITKIGPVKPKMEELVEVLRIDTKIEKGKTLDSGDVAENSTNDDHEHGKTKNDNELGEPYILAKNESERNNASEIRLSKRSENISETKVMEGIAIGNGSDKEDRKKANTTNETAKVMENMDFLGLSDKCACTSTDQVPVLVLDKLKKIEKVNKVEVKIFKVELDLDDDSFTDLEDADKTRKSSMREKPLR